MITMHDDNEDNHDENNDSQYNGTSGNRDKKDVYWQL